MHLEAKIELTQGCTWRRGLRKFGDVFGDYDRANLEAMSSHFCDILGCHNQSKLEEYLQAVNLEGVDWDRGVT